MRVKKLSDKAYDQIKNLIQTQVFKPGDSLPENRLSEMLKMSRTPIREALQRLEEEQIVILRPRLGAFVATIDFNQLCNLYETREAIDGMMANLCCKPHVSIEPFIEMRKELEEIININNEEKRINEMHNFAAKFSQTLRSSCENPMLAKYSETIATLIENFSRVTHSIPLFPNESAPERLDILNSIIAKDAELAEKSARNHVRQALSRILNSVMQRNGF